VNKAIVIALTVGVMSAAGCTDDEDQDLEQILGGDDPMAENAYYTQWAYGPWSQMVYASNPGTWRSTSAYAALGSRSASLQTRPDHQYSADIVTTAITGPRAATSWNMYGDCFDWYYGGRIESYSGWRDANDSVGCPSWDRKQPNGEPAAVLVRASLQVRAAKQ
jgi:hypothetical protein